jgi:fatty-acyl-CoA synthase
LIKSGGENIYPAEIERVMLRHEFITEAVVVRIKSKKWGESPIAIISTSQKDKEKIIIEDLKKSCRKYLAGYKQPVEILVIKETDIPRSTTGKGSKTFSRKDAKIIF